MSLTLIDLAFATLFDWVGIIFALLWLKSNYVKNYGYYTKFYQASFIAPVSHNWATGHL